MTAIPRPGVEVVQEIQATSPTVITPTLVPCIIAPYFEVIEVLTFDGALNSNAQVNDLYDQLAVTVPQASFPSPRGNIDEVNVEEDTIRAFLHFGGSLMELKRDEAFLVDLNIATQPSMTGLVAGPTFTGIDGTTLIINLDSHTSVPAPAAGDIPASGDVTITFSTDPAGGSLDIAEIVNQINAILPGVASNSGSDELKLTSTTYGAGASVVVRKTGTANAILGFSYTNDQYAAGAGFYAVDDSDGDLVSPRLEVYEGTTQIDVGGTEAGVISAPDFIAKSIEAGDSVYANGVAIGAIAEVSSTRLTMEVAQNLMKHPTKFAPRYLWVQAVGLSYPAGASSTAASQTATEAAADKTAAYIVSGAAYSGTISAGQSLTVAWAKDGVAQTDQSFTFPSPVTSITAAVAAINGASPALDFEAFPSNEFGDEQDDDTRLGLRLKTAHAGSGGSITLTNATSEFITATGFVLNSTDIGEGYRYYKGAVAFVVGDSTSQDWQTSGARTSGQTVDVVTTVAGVAQTQETITWSASHTADGAGIIAAIADWNDQSVYTEAYAGTALGVEETPAATSYFCIRTLGENKGENAKIDVKATGTDATVLPSGVVLGADNGLDGATFQWSIDTNSREYTIVLTPDEDDGSVSQQQIIDKINELTPGIAGVDTSTPPKLKLTSNKVGSASEIEVLDGTANAFLGFSDDVSVLGTGRPNPDLAIDLNGDAVVQGQLLRDGLIGLPYSSTTAPLYMAYKGLRLDLSPAADNPGLTSWSDVSDIEELADPISLDNPGALMSYLAKLNAPQISVASIGVGEVSASAPTGTPQGYAAALEFLESEEVYALAMASDNAVVHQNSVTHVETMSAAEQKGERITLFAPPVPDRARPDTVGSGTDANTTGVSNQITVENNIASRLIELGINPNLDINPTSGPIENEVYLSIGSDDKYYLVQKVESGTKITMRTSFVAGDGNADSFYSEDTLPMTVISDDWVIYLRGEELTVAGVLNKNGVVSAVAGAAEGYGSRRAYYVFPDQCVVNVSGIEQVVDGYYATACIAGMIGRQTPQQGFTNFPITGLVTVNGSNDTFKSSQLNTMAGGGVYILVHDEEGGPVTCRHQLSTDTTSLETRELSITKLVDYTAKVLRTGIRRFIGRSNITQSFIDNLSTIIEGLLEFLIDNHVLLDAEVNNLIQDEDNPDTLLLDITLDVPYPCNFIRIVLMV